VERLQREEKLNEERKRRKGTGKGKMGQKGEEVAISTNEKGEVGKKCKEMEE
jgi:hypothetical protein